MIAARAGRRKPNPSRNRGNPGPRRGLGDETEPGGYRERPRVRPALPLADHPAPAERLLALTDQCVQCGLCLPACPTYALEPLETESPRGRIALIKAWDAGLASPTEAGDQHLDHCLGCRRCEVVCPAGVRYGEVLALARTAQRERRYPGQRQRFVESLAAHPSWLQRLLRLYRRLYLLLPQALRPLPKPPPKTTMPARRVEIGGDARDLPGIALFLGCVARGYDGAVYAALSELCATAGVRLERPEAQTCCGALHAHAGDAIRTQALAAQNRTAFAPSTTVLNLASGCHEHLVMALREHNDVVDAIVWLEQRVEALRFAPRRERIALHLPCTQRNVSRSDAALRRLLARVPELDIVELDAGFGCCGAAGTQMLTDPERAARFRQPLLDQFTASGATRLLSANIGCRLHLANGTALPVQHPLEFLGQCLA
jgi:glycolate oxidase iron-sulfur subunit